MLPEPGIWASSNRQPWPLAVASLSQEILRYQTAHWVSASFLEQQCSVMPSMIMPFWPLPAPRRMASKFLSQLVSNNIQMVRHKPSSPRRPGSQVPRQRLAQAMLSCCLSKSKGPCRLLVAWECQFHAQEVEKEAAGLEHFLEGRGLTR